MRALCVAMIAGACACGGAQRPATAGPELVVLGAGAEPRRVLRYVPTPGARERVEADFKVSLVSRYTNTTLETGQTGVDSPTVRRTLVLEARPVAGSGDVDVGCVIEDVKVLDDVIDAGLRARVEAMAMQSKGLRGSWRVSPTGQVMNVKLDAPKEASAPLREQLANLRETLERSAVVYPDVPVGVGASWQVKRTQTLGKAMWTSTTTYSLRDLTETTATIDTTLSANASSQALSVEPSRTVRLTSGASEGQVHNVVRLHGIVAASELQTRTELNLQIVQRHLRVSNSVTVDTLLVIRHANEAR